MNAKNRLRDGNQKPTMGTPPATGDQNLPELDSRLNAFRPDLADARLRGTIDAETYVEGRPGRVNTGQLPLLTAPSRDSRMGSEVLFGESVTIFEVRDGWAWLQNQTDSYVGYARAEGLGDAAGEITHRISALRTFLYAKPDLKSPVLDVLSMNSLLCEQGRSQGFIGLATGGWVWAKHAAAMDEHESDHAAVALRFLGTPYLWGGRSSIGLDCSGLVQMALARCGKTAPRDSDMQACDSGAPVAFDGDYSVLRHGDHIIWPGHCGLWLDEDRFVHANATDMMVSMGPLVEIAAHIERIEGHRISAVRRP